MKRILLSIALIVSSIYANAQNTVSTDKVDSLAQKTVMLQSRLRQCDESMIMLKNQYQELNLKVNGIESNTSNLTRQYKKVDSEVELLGRNIESIRMRVDSLYSLYRALGNKQQEDNVYLVSQVGQTQQNIEINNNIINNRTIWGIACFFFLFVAVFLIIVLYRKKSKKDSDSIDEVRKTQKILEDAQRGLQEESLKLDNKLLEVVEKQLNDAKHHTAIPESASETDHSLALKIADEIVRIEANLSRMDSSIKGHKQLSKAVERIKNNFSANGYEIVDMLGKPYIQGMKAAVTFVTDDSLESGIQIISKIIKPQINYKQEMIQAAQIEVSQAE